MAPKRQVPPFEVLKNHYVLEYMTWQQIADKYGFRRDTIYNAARRNAQSRGETFPFKVDPKILRWKRQEAGKKVHDSCNGELVLLELQDFIAASGWTYKKFAEVAGLHPSMIYNFTTVSRWKRPRMSRVTADKIMKVVMEWEEGREKERKRERMAQARVAKAQKRREAA